MNKNIFSVDWQIFKEKIKAHWAELTEDELMKIKADSQEIYGILEKKYGYAKEEAKERVQDFINNTIHKADALYKDIDQLKRAIADIADKVTSHFAETTGRTAGKMYNYAHDGEEKIVESIKANPLASLGIAALVGFLLGAITTKNK